MKCGDFGGMTEAGKPCGRIAGWGRPGVSEGPCRHHSPELKPLTPLEARFVDEIFLDWNQAAAYRRAGGSPTSARQCAHDLMKKPEVLAAIQKRREELREEVGIRQQRVLEEIAALAFSDLRRVMTWGEDGVQLKASDELDDAAAAAISEIRQTAHGIVVKLHSKGDAIQKLGQNLGMFVERSFNFDIDWHSLPEEALERIMAGENPFTVLVSLLQSRQPEGGDG